jgi:hypothetical protein
LGGAPGEDDLRSHRVGLFPLDEVVDVWIDPKRVVLLRE